MRRSLALIDAGPEDHTWPHADAASHLDTLFPPATGVCGDEAAQWALHGARVGEAADLPVISATTLIGWARSHRSKGGDHLGWSAQLILDLCRVDSDVARLLAAFWSASPASYSPDHHLFAAVFRECAGHLLRQEGKEKPRPISAPSLCRRIRGCTDARRARAAVALYAGARGHVGLGHDGDLAAYSLWPQLVVKMGGTALFGDRTASYQMFSRNAILDASSRFLASAEASARPAGAAAFARLISDFVVDWPSAPRGGRTTTVFRRYGDDRRVANALAQGCSSSPILQTIILAAGPVTSPTPAAGGAAAAAPHPAGILRRGAHDDLFVTAPAHTPTASIVLPPCFGGGSYNLAKSVAVGSAAAAVSGAGHAARAAAYVVFWVPSRRCGCLGQRAVAPAPPCPPRSHPPPRLRRSRGRCGRRTPPRWSRHPCSPLASCDVSRRPGPCCPRVRR